IGLLISDVKHDYVRSKLAPLAQVTPVEVNGMFDELTAQARAELDSDGFAPDHIRIERALDLRYGGQGYGGAVPCPARGLAAGALGARPPPSAGRHDALSGNRAPRARVEIVSSRVRATGLAPPVAMPKFKPAGGTLADARRETRRARFDGTD